MTASASKNTSRPVWWDVRLPNEWRIVPLKYVVEMKSGEQISAEDIKSSGTYPVYGGNGLRGYTEGFTHDGDFALIGRQGALCGNVNYASGKFWASEHAVVVKPRIPCPTKWLGETLRAMNLGKYSMTAAQPGLAVDAIKNLCIPLPDVGIRAEIADFLDAETAKVQALVAKYERLIELLEEKRVARITHAVTKGLDPNATTKDSGVEWIGRIPQHWHVEKTKFVATLKSGHTPSRNQPEYWMNCTIPWVTLADVGKIRDGRLRYLEETNEQISEMGLANSAAELLPAGTVIVSRTASVGYSAIISKPMATTQDFVNWVCGPRIVPEYLLAVFRAMKPEFARLTNGSVHQTIYMPDVNNFVTPVPPLNEQQRIADYVERETNSLFNAIDAIRAAIALSKERRAALITAAVTGQIDVRSYKTKDLEEVVA